MSPDLHSTRPLERRLTVFPATALNMANMIGVGPFITIPLLMSALGGPQFLLGWLVALAITVPDALIWSELGAALPGSGGTYRWLLEGFGARTWGRLMAFLFLWQFLISGPMEIASGYIGVANYLDYLSPGMMASGHLTMKGGLVVVAMGLLYPLPLIAAGVGWLLVFATTPPRVIAFALAALAMGVIAYFGWARITRKWPFGG